MWTGRQAVVPAGIGFTSEISRQLFLQLRIWPANLITVDGDAAGAWVVHKTPPPRRTLNINLERYIFALEQRGNAAAEGNRSLTVPAARDRPRCRQGIPADLH